MRMSFSRLAAVGAVLAAGVTLASCASSASPIAASGPNPAAIGFPGGSARVHFIQGSPQLNLLVNNTDVYIDNKLAFPNFYYPFAGPGGAGCPATGAVIPVVPATSGPVCVGPVTPYIELPIGQHDFRLVKHGTAQPTFLEAVVTLKANTKYAIVAEGDAGYFTTTFGVFIEPVYATPVGIRSSSVFNASPLAGTLDFWYGCANPNGPCTSTGFTGTLLGGGITVGGLGAAAASWKTNVLLKPSPTGNYCFGAYPAGSATIIPAINAAAGPPNATWPAFSADDPQNLVCATSVAIGPGTSTNFYVLDAPSTPPQVPTNGPSTVLAVPDQNG
jgi:hypothetical protein